MGQATRPAGSGLVSRCWNGTLALRWLGLAAWRIAQTGIPGSGVVAAFGLVNALIVRQTDFPGKESRMTNHSRIPLEPSRFPTFPRFACRCHWRGVVLVAALVTAGLVQVVEADQPGKAGLKPRTSGRNL